MFISSRKQFLTNLWSPYESSNFTENIHNVLGYYKWKQVHAAERQGRIMLDGTGDWKDPADPLLIDKLEELQDWSSFVYPKYLCHC